MFSIFKKIRNLLKVLILIYPLFSKEEILIDKSKLIEDLDSSNVSIRYASLRKLSNALDEETIEILTKYLKKEQDNYLKSEIIEILSLSGSTVALAGIKDQLNDKNLYIRQTAVRCLGNFDEKLVIPELVKVINRRDEDLSVKKTAVWVVGRFRSKEAISLLDNVISDQQNSEELKLLAVRALGKIGTKESRNALRKYITSKNSNLRSLVEQELIKK
ncbi:MAG: HEAT repeat domain-containing protein [Endomicrobiia bacterium]